VPTLEWQTDEHLTREVTTRRANDNLTADGLGDTYTWDARNHLSQAATSSLVVKPTYDGFGRRMKFLDYTNNSYTVSFLYDGLNPVHEQNTNGNNADLLTGLGLDEVFTRTDNSGTMSLLRDKLNSTVALVDSSGTVQGNYHYEPFGNTDVFTDNANPYQWTGRENDPLGLYYMRARYYAPYLMRFISPDPLGFGGGDTNLYRYVGNDPVDFTDPSGLKGSSSGGPVGGLDDPSDDRRNRGGKELPPGEQARPNEVDIPGGGQTTPLPLSVQTVFISSGLGGGLSFGGGLSGPLLGQSVPQFRGPGGPFPRPPFITPEQERRFAFFLPRFIGLGGASGFAVGSALGYWYFGPAGARVGGVAGGLAGIGLGAVAALAAAEQGVLPAPP
jgi:RHS repeat-associated protein